MIKYRQSIYFDLSSTILFTGLNNIFVLSIYQTKYLQQRQIKKCYIILNIKTVL